MLGKGLESLIPPRKGDGNGANEPAQLPIGKPVEPDRELSAPPMSVALPSKPQQPGVQQSKLQVQPLSQSEPQPRLQSELAPRREPPRFPREGEAVFHIEIEKIVPNPSQPRRHFGQTGLQDLAHSIREFGFLQPLVVSKIEKETQTGVDVEYQLIAGERRLMAAKLLGLHSIPAIVRNVNLDREKLELAVIENIQRENLNPIETARAFQRLQEEFRMTQREIAVKLGKSREVVANAVRLLDLPEYIREAVEKGQLSESNARLLLTIPDPGAQKNLFEDIIHHHLTTRDVKTRVQQTGNVGQGTHRRGRPPKSEEHLPPELKAMEQSLSMELGAPVEIHKGQNTGKITITFYSEEELEGILRRLGKEGP